ncbi:hypothetical protein [Methylobacterium sp. 092160098-2]|uniref:hypothetical protein n=1 Tax=Methylobacterium sp. 092160098-2 TaxID=3025129 RepID=UPI002381CCB0|nr:hypothetical protein [Methylobacterium sp. 092160098-2]MDE4914768.1 hypothetical protein [Methylobacterium sp. 092160098-2]
MAESEDVQVQSADALDFGDIEHALRSDFEKRLHAVRAKLADLLSHGSSRDVLAALMGLDDQGRHTLLRHVVSDLSGPTTINGLEELARFVSYYVLDDGEVLVVPDVDPEVDDVGVAAIMANYAGTDESPHEALEAWRNRERPVTLIRSDESARAAGGPEIVAAIRSNLDFERRDQAARDASYAAFMADDGEDEDLPASPSP